MPDRNPLVNELIEVKNRHQASLSAVPGVHGLGVGVVYKNGERTHCQAASSITSTRLSAGFHVGVIPQLKSPRASARVGQKGMAWQKMSVPRTGLRRGVFALAAMTVVIAQCGPPGEQDTAIQDTSAPQVVTETTTPPAQSAETSASIEWGEGTISCTEEVVADRERHIEVLIEVKTRHQIELSKIPGVVGIGAGWAHEDGKRNRDVLTINVGVSPDTLDDEADPWDLVPSTIEGCKVSVYWSRTEPVSSR